MEPCKCKIPTAPPTALKGPLGGPPLQDPADYGHRLASPALLRDSLTDSHRLTQGDIASSANYIKFIVFPSKWHVLRIAIFCVISGEYCTFWPIKGGLLLFAHGKRVHGKHVGKQCTHAGAEDVADGRGIPRQNARLHRRSTTFTQFLSMKMNSFIQTRNALSI